MRKLVLVTLLLSGCCSNPPRFQPTQSSAVWFDSKTGHLCHAGWVDDAPTKEDCSELLKQ